MLTHLIVLLFMETVSPSYVTLSAALPEQLLMHAQPPLSLAAEKTPERKSESIAPVVAARSIYAVDLTSGEPLFVRDIFTRRPIASIAKLVTAMVILDSHALDEKVKASSNAASQEGSRMGLLPGEEITVESLLTGMLVNSGNDAAVALAEFAAGSEEAFVKKMNAKVSALGLKNTRFLNAKGFDEEGSYSTAFDTMLFSRAALDYAFIRKTMDVKEGTVYSASGKTAHPLKSTNELLAHPHYAVIGLKTGHTPAAGESFVSLVKGPSGHEILTVMLDSPDRFKETKIVIEWMLRTYMFP